MSIANELSRKKPKAENGNGRQAKIHQIPVPEDIFNDIQLCITAYRAHYKVRVTYETMLRRWTENFGRFDPAVFKLFLSFKGDTQESEPESESKGSDIPVAADTIMETEAEGFNDLHEIFSDADDVNKWYEELMQKKERERELRKAPYLMNDAAKSALSEWKGAQDKFVQSELIKMSNGENIIQESGEKLYCADAECFYPVFRNKASKLVFTNFDGKNTMVFNANSHAVLFWMK